MSTTWKEAVSLGTLNEGPHPPDTAMFEHVYKEIPPHLVEQRRQLGEPQMNAVIDLHNDQTAPCTAPAPASGSLPAGAGTARCKQMMRTMSMVKALNSAMDVALEKDPDVVIFGEDVGYFGGVFRCTEGLQQKYGEDRVFDTPIAEGGIVATAIGMGANGLRPVVEIQFADYIYPAFDQIASELARLRYRSAGQFWSPVTIRTPCGGGIRGGQTHSQTPEALFCPQCAA